MESGSLFEVGDALQSVALSLNYSSLSSLNKDVNQIQEWIKTQKHFPEVMNQKKIQNFLILNKGSIERTKEKIDNYYTIRSKLPEIFNEINPKHHYQEICLSSAYFIPLPKLTKDLYRVFLFKVRDKSVIANFDPIYGIRYLVNLQELRLTYDITYGDIFVYDGKDLPLSTVLKITPLAIYKALVVIYKRVFSNRLKGVYVLNAPSFLEKFLTLVKKTLKPKLHDRIHFIENPSDLIKHIGKEVLPVDYGGDEKSLEVLQEVVRRTFKENTELFDKLDELRVDEDLRPEELKDDEILGFYGNFKKLDID